MNPPLKTFGVYRRHPGLFRGPFFQPGRGPAKMSVHRAGGCGSTSRERHGNGGQGLGELAAVRRRRTDRRRAAVAHRPGPAALDGVGCARVRDRDRHPGRGYRPYSSWRSARPAPTAPSAHRCSARSPSSATALGWVLFAVLARHSRPSASGPRRCSRTIAGILVVVGGILSTFAIYQRGVARGAARWVLAVPTVVAILWVIIEFGWIDVTWSPFDTIVGCCSPSRTPRPACSTCSIARTSADALVARVSRTP